MQNVAFNKLKIAHIAALISEKTGKILVDNNFPRGLVWNRNEASVYNCLFYAGYKIYGLIFLCIGLTCSILQTFAQKCPNFAGKLVVLTRRIQV